MKIKILIFFVAFSLFGSSLSAMNATQLYWQIQREVEKEKVKERYIDFPKQLIAAVENQNDYEVARLLQAGVNPNTRNRFGMPILDHAIYYIMDTRESLIFCFQQVLILMEMKRRFHCIRP